MRSWALSSVPLVLCVAAACADGGPPKAQEETLPALAYGDDASVPVNGGGDAWVPPIVSDASYERSSNPTVDAGGDGDPCSMADTLNDPKNCGFCGHDCLGGACKSGKCDAITIADNQPAPIRIAVNATHVYWVNQGLGGQPGAVMRATLDGKVREIVVPNQSGALSIALDANNVYWTNQWENAVRQAPLDGITDGGAPLTIASNQTTVSGIAVDANYVYWANYGDGFVRRVPKGGGAIEDIASGQPGPASVAVDATHVYWTNFDGGTIARRALAGGPVEPLASGQAQPLPIAVDAASVYWSNYQNGSVAKCPLAGGAVTPIASGGAQALSLGVAIDSTTVYWTTTNQSFSGTGIMKQSLSSGSTSPVYNPSFGYPSGIAVDSNSIYWTNFYFGAAVYRIAK